MSINTRFMRKGYTIEDYKMEADLFNDYQSFFQNSLRNRLFSHKNLILCYLFCYHFITAEQSLQLFGQDMNKLKSEHVFFSRIEKEGLIKCIPARENDTGRKVFFLSSKGKKYMENFLGTTHLDQDCIRIMMKRCRQQRSVNHFAHNLSVNDLDIALYNFPEAFSATKETVFRTSGELIPLDELLRGSINEEGVIQADNYIQIKDSGICFFQEQDMATQRFSVLEGKLNKYVEFCRCAGFDKNILLFTLNSTLRSVTPMDKPDSSALSHKKLLAGIALPAIACVRQQGDNSPYPDWLSLSVGALDKYCLDILNSIVDTKYTTRLKSLRDIFDYYLQKDVYITVGQMLEQVNLSVTNLNTQKGSLAVDYHNNSYLKRRELFRKLTASSADFQTAAIQGMSLFAIPNFAIPEFFLTGFHCFKSTSSHLLQEFLPLCGILDKESYEYNLMETGENNIAFRNKYTFSDRRIYIEDISSDLGAMERLRYYVSTLDHAVKAYLICLVSDADMEYVRKMLDGSRYGKFSDTGYLMISFFSADAFRRGEIISCRYTPGHPFSKRIL